MLFLSVIQCKEKEKERLVKRGREKTQCHCWMNSTTRRTLSIFSLSPVFLSHVYAASVKYTRIEKGVYALEK